MNSGHKAWHPGLCFQSQGFSFHSHPRRLGWLSFLSPSQAHTRWRFTWSFISLQPSLSSGKNWVNTYPFLRFLHFGDTEALGGGEKDRDRERRGKWGREKERGRNGGVRNRAIISLPGCIYRLREDEEFWVLLFIHLGCFYFVVSMSCHHAVQNGLNPTIPWLQPPK